MKETNLCAENKNWNFDIKAMKKIVFGRERRVGTLPRKVAGKRTLWVPPRLLPSSSPPTLRFCLHLRHVQKIGKLLRFDIQFRGLIRLPFIEGWSWWREVFSVIFVEGATAAVIVMWSPQLTAWKMIRPEGGNGERVTGTVVEEYWKERVYWKVEEKISVSLLD